MLSIFGGQPLRFAPLIELYHRALREYGHSDRPVAAHSPGHIADTDAQAREDLWPHYAEINTRIGRERGWPPTTRAQFDAAAGPDGALFVGSPETVAKKLVTVVNGLGLARFDLKYSMGTLPHSKLMHSIELFGSKVAPLVREALAQTTNADINATA